MTGSPKTQQSLKHWELNSDLNLFAATRVGSWTTTCNSNQLKNASDWMPGGPR